MSLYSLHWSGKDEAQKEVFKAVEAKENIKFLQENLLINGENLEVLKLMRREYKDKIDVIYIDPPYNTKNHKFVYEDNFTKNQTDKHSGWLNFMYPRLVLACGMLSEGGMIFISIDDNEAAQLKIVCDEVFGEVNFISQLIWQKKNKPSFLHAKVARMNEYVLCYAKNIKKAPMLSLKYTKKQKAYPLNFKNNPIKELRFKEKSVLFKLDAGLIKACDMSSTSIDCFLLDDVVIQNGVNINPFRLKSSWRYTQEYLDVLIEEGAVLSVSTIPFRVNYMKSNSNKKMMHNLLTKESYGIQTYEDGSAQIIGLFGYEAFSKAKPVGFIKTLLKSVLHEKKEAIILDFFAGSGTTAHAVMELNKEDKGKRKYILVQSNEKIKKSSKNFQNRYANVYEITKDRIDFAIIKNDFKNGGYTEIVV
ncbi:site-specific DNA-methyltransferase [bacterium]|nr:site-specific DNA-methyltransferase [bacterium]MBU1993957.1 site-specific DNA-methyltransferase [bacterium]